MKAIRREREQADKDAMQQALEALKMALNRHAWLSQEYQQLWAAKTALKERLA